MENFGDLFAIAGQICLVATGITATYKTRTGNKYVDIILILINRWLAGNIGHNKNADDK